MPTKANDSFVFCAVAHVSFRLQAARELSTFACASRRAQVVVEDAARFMVRAQVPEAALPSDECWTVHACLLSALRGEEHDDVLPALYAALYGVGAVAAGSREPFEAADRLVDALLRLDGPAAHLFGPRGPTAMIPLQRRLLQTLCFGLGALRLAPALAQLGARKARGTAWEMDAAQDLLHVMTVRSDATVDFGAGATPSTSELAAAITAATTRPYPQSPEAQRWLGSALATCAQSCLHTLRPGELAHVQLRLGTPEDMLRQSWRAHGRAIRLATAALRSESERVDEANGNPITMEHREQEFCQLLGAFACDKSGSAVVSPDDNPEVDDELQELLSSLCATGGSPRSAVVQLGRCLWGFAEFWHSIAYVSTQHLADGESSSIFNIDAEDAANAALDAFEAALRVFHAANCDEDNAEGARDYAEVLLGYGKVLLCFFDDEDACEFERPVQKSLKLHEQLWGASHPRTLHVQRLCRYK